MKRRHDGPFLDDVLILKSWGNVRLRELVHLMGIDVETAGMDVG